MELSRKTKEKRKREIALRHEIEWTSKEGGGGVVEGPRKNVFFLYSFRFLSDILAKCSNQRTRKCVRDKMRKLHRS